MASHSQPPSQNSFKVSRRAIKSIMKSHRIRLPKYDLPIRFRPWFLLFTSLVMVMLALLTFTNFSRALPLNDKLLHFLCFCIATGIFYFIFDVEEEVRRIWFWRHAGLIFTGVVCFFFGGIMSELVQSMLPYKEFDVGDVAANLLGSSIGLFLSYNLEKYYRHRREIARLYRPLDTDAYYDSDEDLDGTSTQLLPTYHQASSSAKSANKASTIKPVRLTNVWDEREEVFGIGGDSDDEESPLDSPNVSLPPTILITESS